MILADTSVWIEFFRGSARGRSLGERLDAAEIVSHAFVLGELTLGHLGLRRSVILSDLQRLSQLPMVAETEVRAMVETRRLFGSGIGWVDAHLLAAVLASGSSLWTFDGALARVAGRIGVTS